MASVKQQGRSGFGGTGDITTSVENNQPPWPEWSDTSVNATQWARLPNKLGGTTRLSPPYEEMDDLFEDPAGLQDLPEGIEVQNWLRPHQLEGPWTLQPDPTLQDVLAVNKHLMTHKIMREIVSSVLCVEREAYHRPFPIEFQSDQFNAPAKSSLWKPWYHVYSRSPAGKEKPHSMQMNPYGKYIVRLFYLGKWRRILVDDRLPVGEKGELLLPISSAQNLWLPLLSKALLRIASLSWTDNNSCVDFSVVHCLTGWIPTTLPTKGCTELQLWCVCCQLLGSTDEVTQAPGCCLPKTCPDDSVTDLPAINSRAIFAVVFNPLGIKSRKITKTVSISSFENLLLVSNVRYDSALPSPLWKEYRWKQWAFDNGIISDMDSKPMRGIQIYNPLTLPTPIQVTDVEDWMDFDIFIKFVRHLEVYYKPSYFKYSLKAWTVSELLKRPNCAEDVVREIKSSRGKGDKKGRNSKSTKSRSITPSPEKKGKPNAKGRKSSRRSETVKSKKGFKAKEPQLSFDDWTAQIDQKPSFFYLLIDSMVCKQLYVCLSAYDSSPPTYAHIFVGKFIWHSSSVAPIVFMLSTYATKGFMLTLSPGLHVYRIWHYLPTHFCLQIYSNTPFSTGSKINIQQILTADSLSFQFYGSLISQKFNSLLDTGAGGGEHGQSYDQLMGALHPPQLNVQLTWPDNHIAHKQIEQAFEESLTEMLADTANSPGELQQTIQAFQLLFLSPKFGEIMLKSIKSDYYDFLQDRRLSLERKEILRDLQLTKAVLEQASNKKEKMSPKSKKGKSKISHKTSIKSPKSSVKSAKLSLKSGKKGNRKDTASKGPSIKRKEMRKMIQCKEKNLLINDPNNSIILIKKVMTKVPHLRHFYPFGEEEDYRLFYQDYAGEINVTDNWLVLIRSVLNLHTTDEVPCSLHIWSPIKNIVLRLIDNDSNRDVPFGFVENQVAFLSKNLTGYTLCVYGWSSAPVEPWRLRVMGISKENLLHVCHGDGCSSDKVAQLPEQRQQSVDGYYIPNKARLITRCHLEVYTDVTVLLRLYLSHPTALCRFTIQDPEGNIIHDATGLGHIVIPILDLTGVKSDINSSSGHLEGKIYVIEVKLLKETWSLTSGDIKSMLYYKERLPDIYYKLKDETLKGSITKSSKETIQSSNLNEFEFQWFESKMKPSWNVTVALDLQKEESVMLRQDLSVFEALEELRYQWDQEGVDLLNCLEIRQQFLHQLNEEEDTYSEEYIFHLKAKRTTQLMKEYGREGYLRFPPTSSQLSSLSSTQSSKYPSSASSSLHSGVSLSNTLSESTPPSYSASNSTFSTNNQTLTSVEKSAETEEVKLDHHNMLVRQTGIHQALVELRDSNMAKLKETYNKTLALRLQVLNCIKTAKVANEKQKTKKGKKSSSPSPDRKGSHKPSKKPKSKK